MFYFGFHHNRHKLLLVILSLLSVSEGLILNCIYSSSFTWTVANLYTCKASIVFVGNPTNVTGVSLNHLEGKTNDDVTGLFISQSSMDLMPQNIEHFFPNLQSIIVERSLVAINRQDIEVFPDLKELNLFNNSITHINVDLFGSNPKLQSISFSFNPIQHVAHNVFDHLSDLEILIFWNTSCISQSAIENRKAVTALTFRVAVDCPPTFEMINTAVLGSVEFEEIVEKRIEARLQPVYTRVKKLEERVLQLESIDGSGFLSSF